MSGCVTCDAIREDEREEEAPHSPWDTHTVDLHALLVAERARGDRLKVALLGYLTLKNPNGKAYTSRLHDLHRQARAALKEGE